MRALIVLLALVAAPYVAGVSQGLPQSGNHALKSGVSPADVTDPGLGHDDAHCAMRAELHPDKDINKCDAAPTPPPPPPPPSTGGEIHGTVYSDANGDGLRDPTEVGLGSWFVMLTGTTIPPVQTAANGDYAFTGLSAGSYTVCAQQRNFYFQTTPLGTACGTQGGFTIVLSTGQVVTSQDFGFFF